MFLTKRKNGFYYLCYTKNNKRNFVSTSSKNKSEALKFLRDFKITENNKPQLLIKQAIFNYLKYSESVHSFKTTKDLQFSLNRFANFTKDIPVESINREQIENFLIKRSLISMFASSKDLRYLKMFFNHCLDNELIKTSPVKNIKRIKTPEKQPTYFSKAEFNKLISIIEIQELKELVLLAVNTGLRKNELLSLTPNQVDFSNGLILLDNKSHIRKSRKVRTIPMNNTSLEILKNMDNRESNKPYFNLKSDRVTKLFKGYVRLAKLNDSLNFHSLRHTFASWLVQSGVSIYNISKLLGHSDIKTTEIYTHLKPDNLLESVKVLDETRNFIYCIKNETKTIILKNKKE